MPLPWIPPPSAPPAAMLAGVILVKWMVNLYARSPEIIHVARYHGHSVHERDGRDLLVDGVLGVRRHHRFAIDLKNVRKPLS